jgi:hypothetical protein
MRTAYLLSKDVISVFCIELCGEQLIADVVICHCMC